MKALAEAKTMLADSALKQRISQLEKSNTAQKESTELVLNSVAQTIKANTALIEKIQAPFNKSDYLVGLQTLGIQDAERIAINEKLSSDGYASTVSHGLIRLKHAQRGLHPTPQSFITRHQHCLPHKNSHE